MLDERKQIWQIGCQALDLVLIGSFEWRELHNLLSTHGLQDVPDASPEMTDALPVEDTLVKIAHDLCHSETPFACHLQSLLDHLHSETIAEVRAVDPARLIDWCLRGELTLRYRIPALVWAIVTDPRDAFERIIPVFLMRLHHASLRLLNLPLQEAEKKS